MNATAKTLSIEPADKLEREVLDWINEKAADYDNGPRGVLMDLAHGGCASGMVSELIYTGDAVKFYERHQSIIDKRLYESLQDCGAQPDKFFANAGWDKNDPLAREDENKVILAWFGFEEAARDLGQRAGIEL